MSYKSKLGLAALRLSCLSVFIFSPLKVLALEDDHLRAMEWKQPQDPSEAALVDASQEESREKYRLEELERQAKRSRELYELKRLDAERQIAEKRRSVEDYKIKQELIVKDIESWQNELAEVEAQQQQTEKELKNVNTLYYEKNLQSSEYRVGLERTRAEFDAKLETLRKKKESTFKMIETADTEMRKWNQEMSENQARIIELDSRVSEYEKIALQVRAQKAELETKLKETQTARVQAEEESRLTKAALAKAQGEYAETLAEAQKAEASKDQALKQVSAVRANYLAEMRNLEAQKNRANLAKVMAEAESQRLTAESDSLKRQLAIVKAQNEAIDSDLASSNTSLMQSRISLQQVRSDLVRQLGVEEKSHLQKDNYVQKMRSLASMANSSELDQGAKPWTLSRMCTIRRTPAYTAEKLGEAQKGERLYAAPTTDEGWVKVLNSSGSAAFIRASCGQF